MSSADLLTEDKTTMTNTGKFTLPKRQAKIICTIGPACRTKEKIKELVMAGLDVARLNFSHGSHDVHAEAIQIIREVSAELGKPVAILQDLQGPKIRTAKMENDAVEIKTGDEITITTEPMLGHKDMVSTTYTNLAKDLNPGDLVLIDDGKLRLEVIESDGVKARCKIIFGGVLKNNKGINLPNLKLSTPALTEKDIADLKFGVESGEIDYIALSFVREAADVLELKKLIKEFGAQEDIPVISKIEKPQALENIDEIIDVTDGLMVARGDLGVELQIERVPVAQKHLIRKANEKQKLVITATQMLESMISCPSPTRAEASDVANAIFDGTDAVMLSGETAAGDFPIEAVETMSAIVAEAERSLLSNAPKPFISSKASDDENINFRSAISELACVAANNISASAVIAITATGKFVQNISKGRTNCPIIALSPHEHVRNRMALYWGVFPVPVEEIQLNSVNRVEDLTHVVEKELTNSGLLKSGDSIIITSATNVPNIGKTNILKLHKVQ